MQRVLNYMQHVLGRHYLEQHLTFGASVFVFNGGESMALGQDGFFRVRKIVVLTLHKIDVHVYPEARVQDC